MKIKNLSFFICHLLFIISFLILPFLTPTTISAINPEASFDISPTITQISTPSSTIATSSANNTNNNPSLLEKILSWIFGLFAKTDYTIDPYRSHDEKIKDMTNYGGNPGEDDTQKHSFTGSRISDSNSQDCLKGSVIKKVILGTDPNNTPLSNICLDSSSQCFVDSTSTDSICKTITIKDLAHYFVQKQQQFYCDPNNKSVAIEQNVIDNVNQLFTTPIPEIELICYQQIYDDFYLTPKDASKDDENTKKMMKTPIPASGQDSNDNVDKIEKKLNQNLSPDDTNAGLSGLRPENDK